MGNSELIAGLDMGSGRVTCLIGAPEPGTGRTRVLGGASVPCPGISGGGVISIIEAKSAVERAIGDAEAAAGGVTVADVVLGARGTHLRSFNNKGALNISRTDREITSEDVRAVVANAATIALSPDFEVLQVVPQNYSLDRQRGVPNPVGMEGRTLEADVHIVTASTSQINCLTKAVTMAGFDVSEVVCGLLATGDLLVTPEEKDLGALLLDLGGQSLSLGIYSQGCIRYSREIGIGSDFITRDLAVGLRTSWATAERLKIAHGITGRGPEDGDLEIEFHRQGGRTLDKVKAREMMGYLIPRVEEIFAVVAEDLQDSPYPDLAGIGGLILTGGGSLMPGIVSAAEELLGLETRIGMANPEQVVGDEKWLSPVYATALGLLAGVDSARRRKGIARFIPCHKSAWWRRFMAVLRGLF